METITIHPKILYFGTPVCILSTYNPNGTTNLSPISSAWALDDRVVLGLGRDGQAYTNLERDDGCVINLPAPAMWRAVERLAPTTGVADIPASKRALGYRHEADKFSLAGWTPLPSMSVRPERIAECPIQLEACVRANHRSTHADPFAIVEVEVLHVHAHRGIVVPDSDHIDAERWAPLLYVFRRYVGAGTVLGQNFRADDNPTRTAYSRLPSCHR